MVNWHETLTGWHKSTYTHHEENACVEIGRGRAAVVGVRDSKQSAVPSAERDVLVFSGGAFRGLLNTL